MEALHAAPLFYSPLFPQKKDATNRVSMEKQFPYLNFAPTSFS